MAPIRTSRRRALALGAVLLIALTSACGDGGSSTPEPSPSSVAPAFVSPSAEPSPTADPTDLSRGLIVSTCAQLGGGSNVLTAYDPNGQDVVLGQVEFNIPEGLGMNTADFSLGGCNGYGGHKGASAYDYRSEQPYSRFFMSRENSDDSIEIGYIDRDGQYNSLSQLEPGDGLQKRIKDKFPAYHGATNRVYYWDTSDRKRDQLMSVSLQGGDNRKESLPGNRGPSSGSFDPGAGLYMPDTRDPIAGEVDEDFAYNAAGTKALDVWGDEVSILSVKDLHKNIRGTKIDASEFEHNPVPVGFMPDDKSVVITDQINIYEVTGGKMTTLFDNQSGKKISDVVMSRSGDIAFTASVDDSTGGVYVLRAGTPKPKLVAKISGPVIMHILRFQG